MFRHVDEMIDELPEIFDKKYLYATPEGNDIFNEVNKKKLSEKKKEQFHTIVAKVLYIAKISRLYIHPTIAALITITIYPNVGDCTNMKRRIR